MTHDLLLRAQEEGTPLLDGSTATFVWKGRHAPQVVGDFCDWEDEGALNMNEVAPEVWTAGVDLPLDAYVEYALVRGGRRVRDPNNSRTTPGGVDRANHYFYMPEGGATRLARTWRGVPHGEVSRYVVASEWLPTSSARTVYLYQPPVGEAMSLLVVLDGAEYLHRVRLPQIVDNLMAQRRIRPVALAMIQNAGRSRTMEYGCSDSFVGYLVDAIVPLAREQLHLLDPQTNPGAFGILGASMGGVQALYTGLRAPGVFGHVVSQSGAFATWDHEFVVFDLVRHLSPTLRRVWMDVGRFEDLMPVNRRMHQLLRERGYPVSFREYSGGHNYPAWRDDVWRGLEYAFGTYPLRSDMRGPG